MLARKAKVLEYGRVKLSRHHHEWVFKICEETNDGDTWLPGDGGAWVGVGALETEKGSNKCAEVEKTRPFASGSVSGCVATCAHPVNWGCSFQRLKSKEIRI
jgi:hypothetical protein